MDRHVIQHPTQPSLTPNNTGFGSKGAQRRDVGARVTAVSGSFNHHLVAFCCVVVVDAVSGRGTEPPARLRRRTGFPDPKSKLSQGRDLELLTLESRSKH